MAPVVWPGSVLDHRYGGTSFDAAAGPLGPRVVAVFQDVTVRYVAGAGESPLPMAGCQGVSPLPALAESKRTVAAGGCAKAVLHDCG